MSGENPTFDPIALAHAQRCFEARLLKHPDDMETRLKLAWCLFMAALYQAGQETVLRPGIIAEGTGPFDPEREPLPLFDRDAQQLLTECLIHTFTIMQLSPHAEDLSDVEKLQTLVKLSGGDRHVARAENEATRLLTDFIVALLRTS